MKDYYRMLQVNENASKEIIEKAYRTLIKKYHPDLQQGDLARYSEEAIKELNEAYNILSDDFLREQYDRELRKEIYSNENRMYEKENQFYEDKNYLDKNNNDEKSKSKKRNGFFSNILNTEEIEHNRSENIGTYRGLVDVIKSLNLQNIRKFRIKDLKKISKVDVFAVGLTIVIMIILGVILWFIPFTNSWIREILENPLFSWIGKLFK